MLSLNKMFAKRQGTGGGAGHLILFWCPEGVRRGGKSGRWLLRRRPVAASTTNYHGLCDGLSCSGDRDSPPPSGSVCFARISTRGLQAGCRVRAATAPAKDLAPLGGPHRGLPPLGKGFLEENVPARAAGDRCSGDSLLACAASTAAGRTRLRSPSPGFREHSGRPRRGDGRRSGDPPCRTCPSPAWNGRGPFPRRDDLLRRPLWFEAPSVRPSKRVRRQPTTSHAVAATSNPRVASEAWATVGRDGGLPLPGAADVREASSKVSPVQEACRRATKRGAAAATARAARVVA